MQWVIAFEQKEGRILRPMLKFLANNLVDFEMQNGNDAK